MQTVTTKYLPATNTRGARIKVSSWLGNKHSAMTMQLTVLMKQLLMSGSKRLTGD